MSDPIVRSENESEEDSDDTEYDSELESDGDDALVQSFFISNWFFIENNDWFLIFPPDLMNLKSNVWTWMYIVCICIL